MSIHENPGGLYDQRHALPNFVNDPAMTVMLLDKMNQDCERRLEISGTTESQWEVYWGPWHSRGKLGEAVADAFMLANGWTNETRR